MSTKDSLQPYKFIGHGGTYHHDVVRRILDDAHAHYEAQVRQLGGLAKVDPARPDQCRAEGDDRVRPAPDVASVQNLETPPEAMRLLREAAALEASANGRLWVRDAVVAELRERVEFHRTMTREAQEIASDAQKRVRELMDQVAYYEAQDGLLSKAQDEAARLRAELAEMQRPLDAQMARLNENLAAANARIAELELEVEVLSSKMARNPWRDAVVTALKDRNRYFERDNDSPNDRLDDLLREVAAAASHTARQQLAAFAGLADQLVSAGLAIRSAQQPEDRNDVALTYQQAANGMEPRIAEDTIPAIDGWKIGRVVQSRYRGLGDHLDNEWRDVGLPGRPCTPNFMHPMMEYRVKPGELVSFCGGTPPIEYEPNPPLNWDDSSDAETGAEDR